MQLLKYINKVTQVFAPVACEVRDRMYTINVLLAP